MLNKNNECILVMNENKGYRTWQINILKDNTKILNLEKI